MASLKVTHLINKKALEILEQHPEGLRWSKLKSEIEESNLRFHPKTVNGCIWKLPQNYSDKVYKPSKGIFRLIKYRTSDPIVKRNRQ